MVVEGVREGGTDIEMSRCTLRVCARLLGWSRAVENRVFVSRKSLNVVDLSLVLKRMLRVGGLAGEGRDERCRTWRTLVVVVASRGRVFVSKASTRRVL